MDFIKWKTVNAKREESAAVSPHCACVLLFFFFIASIAPAPPLLSNKPLMMYSYKIFYTTWNPSVNNPAPFTNHSFVCIVKDRAICCKKPNKALFYIVSVCLRSLSEGWGDLSCKCDWSSLYQLPWRDVTRLGMRLWCCRQAKTHVSGYVWELLFFHVHREQKIIATNCLVMLSLIKSCTYLLSSSFYVITLLSFSHSKKF